MDKDVDGLTLNSVLVYQGLAVSYDNELQELSSLALSAGVAVAGQLLSKRESPVAATFIGKGKLEELKKLVEELEANIVIFDNDISAIQERNISNYLKCKVLSRTGLILDIFAQRAQSREGKLQVELAQLKYLSTRLIRGWTHLERQKGGIGLRGPGETQLEVDRRLISKRIRFLSDALDKISMQSDLRRKLRVSSGVPRVALVGYTNAGKSTLFNLLTNSQSYVADKLFATLDSTVRQVSLEKIGSVIFSDTVGFVKKLPHTLISSFRSTLAEVEEADCLLLVSDVSESNHLDLIQEVEVVLDEIDAGHVPVIYVYNKVDLLSDDRVSCPLIHDAVVISAQSQYGIANLKERISKILSASWGRYRLKLNSSGNGLRALLHEKKLVLQENYAAEGCWEMEISASHSFWSWLEKNYDFSGALISEKEERD